MTNYGQLCIKTGSLLTFQPIYLMLNSNYTEGQCNAHLFPCLHLMQTWQGEVLLIKCVDI